MTTLPALSPPQQRFVDVSGRRVHYLRMGSGPPVVMSHMTPGTAWVLVPQMKILAQRFTCFAFDTPGLGLSDPLPPGPLTIDDLADALADTLVALGIARCPAFGAASGAAISLALARRHPQRLCGVFCDGGAPLFTPEEADQFQDAYTPPIVIDDLAGHYTSSWTHFRDSGAWVPWHIRRPANLQNVDQTSAMGVHSQLITIFRGRKDYRRIVKAVIASADHTPATLDDLTIPAFFHLPATRQPFMDLDRLAALKPLHRVFRTSGDPGEKEPILLRGMTALSEEAEPPGDKDAPISCRTVQKHFVDLSTSQMMVRHCGDLTGKPVLLLHDAPGSAMSLEPLLVALSEMVDVYAPDLPGCGESDPLPGEAPTLSAFCEAVRTGLDQLNLQRVSVYGVGFGASLASAFTRRFPERVERLVLESPLLPDDDERIELRHSYAPPLHVEDGGSHWYKVWLMLRDSQVYWPWYNHTRLGLRRVEADFSGDHLHDWTFEVVKQLDAYHHLINAVLDEAPERAPLDEALMLLCENSRDPFAVYSGVARRLWPTARLVDRDPDVDRHASRVGGFLTA